MAYFYRFPDWGNIDFVIYFRITVTSWGPYYKQFPGASQGALVVKICRPMQDSQETQILRVDPWVQEIPWRGKWHPIPVFLPGKFHGQGSMANYSPWGHKE